MVHTDLFLCQTPAARSDAAFSLGMSTFLAFLQKSSIQSFTLFCPSRCLKLDLSGHTCPEWSFPCLHHTKTIAIFHFCRLVFKRSWTPYLDAAADLLTVGQSCIVRLCVLWRSLLRPLSLLPGVHLMQKDTLNPQQGSHRSQRPGPTPHLHAPFGQHQRKV